MREAWAYVKEDGDQPQRAALLRGSRTLCDPPPQIKSKSQKDKPRGDEPTEIVRQRNAKIGAALMPYPYFCYRRLGPVHHQIPLRHHKCGDKRQGDEVWYSIQPSIGAIEQRRGDNPRKVAGAEPQWSDDDRDASNVWKIGVDLEMIVPEGEACGHANIFDDECDCN